MDLRVERTYALLMRAFSELIEEKSLAKMSVSELCERAMIRRTTFYDHFTDKYDFFRYYVRRTREEMSRNILSVSSSDDFSVYCREMTCAFANALEEQRGALRHMDFDGGLEVFAHVVAQEIAKEMKPVVVAELEARGAGKDAAQKRATLFVMFYSQGLIGIMLDWLARDQRESTEELMELFDSTVIPMVNGFFANCD